jgi:hypothetical protein
VTTTIPDSPAGLAEWLAGPHAMQALFGYGPGSEHRRAEFHRSYVAAFNKLDGGQVAGQLRDQAGDLYPLLKAYRPRSSALQALYRADAPGAGGQVPFASFGEMLREVAAAGRSPRHTTGKLTALRNSFSTDVPSDGGFAVPEDWRSDMILASLESAIVRPGATVVPAASGVLHVPALDDTTHSSTVFGGIQGFWADEATAATDTSAKVLDMALSMDKLITLSSCSNELLADAPAFQTVFVNRLLPQAVAWFEDDKFIGGTGAGEPLGLVNAPCKVAVTRGTASTVKFADVIAMLTRLLPQSYSRAVWLCSPDVVTQLLGDFLNFGAATTGITPPPDWLTFHDGQWRLLGLPLYVTEHVAALGGAGDLVLADRSFYLVADRLHLQVSASPHPAFNIDKTQIKVVNRARGEVWLGNPVVPKNGSAGVSPVVRLE